MFLGKSSSSSAGWLAALGWEEGGHLHRNGIVTASIPLSLHRGSEKAPLELRQQKLPTLASYELLGMIIKSRILKRHSNLI